MRLDDLPNFYHPNSAPTWNDKPFEGVDGVQELVSGAGISTTKHEVQSFDCHHIPGTSLSLAALFCPDAYLTFRAGSQPPSLLVTVSGIVTHGKGPAANPANTPRSAVDGHPRVFSQTFMLAPDPNAPPTKSGEVAKYYITADALRFVG